MSTIKNCIPYRSDGQTLTLWNIKKATYLFRIVNNTINGFGKLLTFPVFHNFTIIKN